MNRNPAKAIEGVLTFLKVCGLWPNKLYSVPYTIYAIIFQTIFTFVYTSFKLINFYFLTEVNLITKELFICLSEVALFVKVFNFVYYNKQLQQMIVDIREFKFMNDFERELYQERQLLFTRIFNFQLLFAELSVVSSGLSPLFASQRTLPYKLVSLINHVNYHSHIISDIQLGIRLIGAMI